MRYRHANHPIRRLALIIGGALLLLLGIGPFLVPVPPLEDTVTPEQLADPDSHFIEVNNLTVHYKQRGSGDPKLLLLHGFAASTFSWREVITPLADVADASEIGGSVVAFDRPAFGLTERPLPGEWEGENPYSTASQVALTLGLMDALGWDRAILVGNSAGGTVAMLTALEHPERVDALILVDAAIYTGGGTPAIVRPLLRTPQMRHLGPLIARRIQTWGEDFARAAWHDPSQLTPEIWAGYKKPLQVENWDRALWELTRASRQRSDLAERLAEVTMPTLVITGDDDRIVPTEQSIRLAEELPNATLVVIPNCGHIPHEECPEAFLEAVRDFLGALPRR
jgi:pimeloyl-ACP methyl ester carboxylesterase